MEARQQLPPLYASTAQSKRTIIHSMVLTTEPAPPMSNMSNSNPSFIASSPRLFQDYPRATPEEESSNNQN